MRARNYLGVLGLVVAIVAAWSAFWWYFAARVERVVAAQRAALAADGYRLTCGDEGRGGYPFHIAFSCAKAELTLPGGERVTSAELRAEGLFYRPDVVVVTAVSPVTVNLPVAGRTVTIDAAFTQGHADIALNGNDMPFVDGAIDDLRATTAGDGVPPLGFAAGHVEGHFHGDPTDAGVVSLTASADAAMLLYAGAAVNAAPIAIATKVDVTLAPDGRIGPGSRIALHDTSMRSGSEEIDLGADLAADAVGGAIDGSITLDIADPGALAGSIAGSPAGNGLRDAGAMLTFIGEKIDGRPGARRIKLQVRNGAVRFQRFELGELPPLK